MPQFTNFFRGKNHPIALFFDISQTNAFYVDSKVPQWMIPAQQNCAIK
jgi:hypothetical protein